MHQRHRCKKRFIILLKNALLTFLFLERSLFSSVESFFPSKPAKILINLLNSCIKRLLSDGFNMAAIKKLMFKKSSSPRAIDTHFNKPRSFRFFKKPKNLKS